MKQWATVFLKRMSGRLVRTTNTELWPVTAQIIVRYTHARKNMLCT